MIGLAPMSILIVEDEKITALRLSEQLSKRGYANQVVESGEACLAHLEEQQPDLILLDHMLPGISGLEVLSKIRASYSVMQLPVIIVTAKSEPGEVVKALKLGANDYIKKPINIGIAAARIRTQLDLHQYYQESLRNKELETVNAMIITYNHEINTPLTTAIHKVEMLETTEKAQQCQLDGVLDNLLTIADILKKIRSVTEKPIKKKTYIGNSRMIAINKKKSS